MAKQLKDYKGINIAACCNISTGCSNDGWLWVALKSILSTLYNVYRQPISKSDKKNAANYNYKLCISLFDCSYSRFFEA